MDVAKLPESVREMVEEASTYNEDDWLRAANGWTRFSKLCAVSARLLGEEHRFSKIEENNHDVLAIFEFDESDSDADLMLVIASLYCLADSSLEALIKTFDVQEMQDILTPERFNEYVSLTQSLH